MEGKGNENQSPRAQKLEQAIGYLTEALSMEPKHHETVLTLGLAYYEKHDFERALEWFDRALALRPSERDAETMCLKGVAHVYLRQYEQAEQAFQTVLQWDPKNSQAQSGLQRTLAEAQKSVRQEP